MKTYWDPVEGQIPQNKFDQSNKKYLDFYQKYINRPKLIKYRVYFTITLIIIISASSFIGIFIFEMKTGYLIISFILLILSTFTIRNLTYFNDPIVFLTIAKKNGWLYNKFATKNKVELFKKKFPRLFLKGSRYKITDEFFGKINFLNISTDFYFSIFEYKIQHGKKTLIYKNNLLAFNNSMKTKYNFTIAPQDLQGSFRDYFSDADIKTESRKFNKRFSIYYNGTKEKNENEIIKLLTPAVIIKLIEIKNRYGDFYLIFGPELVIFVFTKNLLYINHTDFTKNIEIDQRDIKNVETAISNYIKTAKNLLQYLN